MHMQVRLLSGLKKLFCEHKDACCAACMGCIGTSPGGGGGYPGILVNLSRDQPSLGLQACSYLKQTSVHACLCLLKRDDSIRKDRELRI